MSLPTGYPASEPDPAATPAVIAPGGTGPNRGVEDGPSAVCQYCLADNTFTPIAWQLPQDKRCPVCGSAYSGPRRSAAYQVLLAAGLVAGSTSAEHRIRNYALGRDTPSGDQ